MIQRIRISCLAMLAAISAGVLAAPGASDPSWGTGGRVQLAPAGYSMERARAAALQPDGRIVVAATTDATGVSAGAVMRFNSDGSADLAFGLGGRYLVEGTPSAIALQPDGGILVAAGVVANSCITIRIVRLLPSGLRDAGFSASTSGVCSPSSFIEHYVPASLAVQPNGGIVAGGVRLGGTGNDFLVARYQANGSLDASFGSGGLVFTGFGATFDANTLSAIALQADGRIVAVGATSASGSSDAAIVLARYNADGTLDTSFGTGGKVKTILSPSFNLTATAVALQPDGKIVVATNRGSVLRYGANGALDSTFGVAGKADGALGGGFPDVQAVALLPDGRMMVAGNASSGYLAVARLATDGSLDATYGVGGHTEASTAMQTTTGVLASGGRMVSAGYRTVGGNDDVALARYTADGTVDSAFGIVGLAVLDVRAQGYAKAVVQQADGKVVVGGITQSAGLDMGFTLARFQRDGTLDSAFGSGGIVRSSLPGLSAMLSGIHLQDDGKIVAVGSVFNGLGSPSLATVVTRYLANGSLDASFGSGGATVLPGGCLATSDPAITPACPVLAAPAHTYTSYSEGILVATVTHAIDPARGMVVVRRLDLNGRVDSTFAGTGAAIVDFQGGNAIPIGLFVAFGDQIVIAALSGAAGAGTATNVSIARLLANGTPDPSFGTDGVVVMPGSVSEAVARRISPYGNGSFLVAAHAGPPDGIVLGRFHGNGLLDTRFGAGGATFTPLSGDHSNLRVHDMAVQRDGRIVVIGGAQHAGTGRDVIAARFTVNGRLDKSYGIAGIASLGDDGSEDAAAAVVQADGRLVIASSSAAAPRYIPAISVARLLGGRLPPGDFDASGTADIVLRNVADGSVVQLLMNGTVATTRTSLGGPGTSDVPRFLGDFNGDGHADIVWEDAAGATSMTLFSGANILADAEIMPAGKGWHVTHVGDLDGDGNDDLIWANASGDLRVGLMNGTTTVDSAIVSLPGWSVAKVGDVDGDGKADIILRHADGTYLGLVMDGLTVTSSQVLDVGGPGWTLTHAADLDGDGTADLIFEQASGPAMAWYMDGMGTPAIARMTGLWAGAGLTGFKISHVGDLDGDGAADFLWSHPDGTVIATLMSSGRPAAVFATSGNPWRIAQVRDFDGDGKADILWRHPDGSLVMWIMDGLTYTAAAAVQDPGPWSPTP